MNQEVSSLVRIASLDEVMRAGCMPIQADGHTIALFARGDQVYALDNRCPHMGFPLHRGTLRDGILTCHWHHARFDLATGGTFDQFADDVTTYPVEIRDGQVWVDLAPRTDLRAHHLRRLEVGLERDIPLVIAKAVLALGAVDGPPGEAFLAGLNFAMRNRRAGWGPGATIHVCMMNLLPHLHPEDRPRALYHGLSAIAADVWGAPPRFMLDPLPGTPSDLATLKRWFRQFIAVRDDEGAERCIVSALEAGATSLQMADMLFAAVTDNRYIQIGHPLDFTNKAFEALDHAGWEHAPQVLASLSRGYARAERMEESNSWRHPIDLVRLVEDAFEHLPAALQSGSASSDSWQAEDELVVTLLGDDPATICEALLEALRSGASQTQLAAAVAHAAALRMVRFHESNEFPDWDTALHTFTFAHAVHFGLRRAASTEVLRGVFDAAMSVYLDRFLNIPPAPLPKAAQSADPQGLLDELPALLNRQHQIAATAACVSSYLDATTPQRLLQVLGGLLLREDRDFHTIQAMEAAFAEHSLRPNSPAGRHMLIAAARYLAAHAPTMRAQKQTYDIARRFARGERLWEGD
jgi:nitrite reductase/ring-hydroxylating ferredoxin subunit